MHRLTVNHHGHEEHQGILFFGVFAYWEDKAGAARIGKFEAHLLRVQVHQDFYEEGRFEADFKRFAFVLAGDALYALLRKVEVLGAYGYLIFGQLEADKPRAGRTQRRYALHHR